jgi:outer membrane protein TolC
VADALLEPPAPASIATDAPIDLARPLTSRDLALIAVLANPDLKAARAQAGVVDAQVIAAGLLPDPTINFSYDKRLSGPDMFDGLGAQVVYELTALRDRRLSLAGARAARAQVRRDLAWREWQTACQARLLAARIVGLERGQGLLARSRGLSAEALDRSLAAAVRGDVRADDVTARRLASADAADKLIQNQRDLAAARQDLNALLGEAPSARLKIAKEALAEPDLTPEALFAQARGARLDLRALRAGYESQEVALRKAVWDSFPTLQLTLSRSRDTANNQTFGPAVTFTLPLWNRNGGGIAAARATREQLAAEYAARVFALRAQISELCAAIVAERHRRDELIAQAGPLNEIARRTGVAALAGDLPNVSAEAARQTAQDKQIALAALDQSIAEQTIALELAVGSPLNGSHPPRTTP